MEYLNKLKLKAKPTNCISHSDNITPYWADCSDNNCIEYGEVTCNTTTCNEPKDGNCEDAIIKIKIKIGEPFLRGITEYTYKVQHKVETNNWTVFKEETVNIDSSENIENYFNTITINTESSVGRNYWRIFYKDNINSDYKMIQKLFKCEKIDDSIYT